jgi:hypothetical protein
MRKRSRALLLATAVAVAVTVSTAPVAAAPAPERHVLDAYVLSDPKLFDEHGNIAVDLRQEGALERLGVTPQQATEARPMTHEQAEDLAIRQGADHGTAAAAMVDDMATVTDDGISPEECRENIELSGRPQGWVKNHFAWCAIELIGANHRACWGPFCRPLGNFLARVTTIGYTFNGLRQADFRGILDQMFVSGTARGSRFTYEVECAGDPDDSCRPGTDWVTKPSALWEVDSEAELYFHSPAEAPDPEHGEQRATGVFEADYRWEFPGQLTTESDGWDTSVRFDSAWYLAQKQGAIFDRSIPWIGISKTNEDEDESADHIEHALNNPNDTVPDIDEDKHIPGGSRDDTIHRLYYDDARRDANREDFAKPACRAEWPNYSAEGKDCDEFPFASTYEGAARHRYQDIPYGMFSVRAIDATDNQTVGRRLGVWYSFDRILDNDRFYVRILD